jgi:UDP-2,4-diacetamido-2,4,6-trideoxy-beta-L-altropyranose hydrolase
MLRTGERQRIILRADANKFIGLGHVSRLLSLAYCLCSDFELLLISDCAAKNLTDEFNKIGVSCLLIPTSVIYTHPDLVGSSELAWDIPSDALKKADIVVLDGYWFGPQYRKRCQEMGLKTVVIDDLGKPISHANMILNHAPGLDPTIFKNKENRILLGLGLSYALLRPVFYNPINRNNTRNWGFVCFGGIDSLMLSAKAAQFLITNSKITKVTVLVSSLTSMGTIQALEELKVRNNDRVEVVQNLNAEEICTLLDKTLYAVVPASTILFEAFFRGCRCLCGITADNQSNIYIGFTNIHLAFGLGDFRKEAAFDNAAELWIKIQQYPFANQEIQAHPYKSILTLFHQL